LLLGALAMTVEKAQAAIEKTGNRLESTFQNAAVGMANLAPDGRYIAVNQRLCCITGFSAAELPGKSFVELTYPEDAAAIAAKMSGMLIGQIASFGLDTRILRKDGSFVWVKSTLGASKAPDGSIDYFIAVIEDISERKRAEESVDTLMHEINHRSKNLLTLVQVIARRTAATNQENFIGRFDERLRALSASQDLLFKSGWPGTTLDALVRSQLAHFRDLVDERITIAGPVLTISAQPAQALGMAIHELATNAGKYGALSNDSGTVAIEWSVHGAPDGQERFRMSWKELGGPPVPLPIGSGFGSTVTTRLVQRSLGGGAGLDFRPSGLIWHLDCPEQNLRDAGMEEAGPAHAAVLS
jgi:PAS domain S-box-containing protein